MQFNSTLFRIDPTPRRADGEYMAHARIIEVDRDGIESDVLMSGDLKGFDQRDEAIAYAQIWAKEWLRTRYG
ncbi:MULTISPECIES: hypothetical protein [Burkholderia]|uniref:Uncharacterized protein n=1 Tax=Burkholderia mayonis TaxID=1385591 RepID=A0A1B4FDC1_9BURK|nr:MULTISPECIES: hypothetical protein [Burkholderia]AOJ01686.1 hypothetical protein WS70_07490 [Burkholderia mayonis]KVE40627.1 hypothetical protein WS69_28860 [Burkholderia sp. BDU5]KVE47455.1 hypothetical protein WS70_26925 [Burkholderia mayonis]